MTTSQTETAILLTCAVVITLLCVPTAWAAPPHGDSTARPGSTSAPRLDIELDPLAFAANGYSVHGGLRVGHLRFDVGAFGMSVPGFLLGSDDFAVRFGGFGVKLDYHFFKGVGGPFVGIAASRASTALVHERTNVHHEQLLHEASLRVGYEFDLAAGLYLAPWISIGHMFGSKDVTVDGDTLEGQPAVTLFPTVHLGYRIQSP